MGADEPLAEKTYLMLSWLVGDATNPEEVVLGQILSLVLMGNEAAPLRKAIIDANSAPTLPSPVPALLAPAATFYIALKGSEADRIEAFTQLVTDTLRQIADSEVESERVEAAFQQLTYHYQEVASSLPAAYALSRHQRLDI